MANVFSRDLRDIEAAHLLVKRTHDDLHFLGKSLSTVSCWEMFAVALETDYKDVYTDIAQIFLENPPFIQQDVIDFINELNRENFVSIISNTSMISGETIRDLLYSKTIKLWPSEMVFSDEQKVAKPNPQIFKCAGHQKHMYPKAHVGDSDHFDGIGAKMAGLDFIKVESPADTIKNVQQYMEQHRAA